MKARNSVRLICFALATALALAGLGGCTADQIARYQGDVTAAQKTYDIAKQATDVAQRTLDQARAIAATMPAGAPEKATADAALAKADAALAAAKSYEEKTDAAMKTAQNVGTALANKTAPDVSPLSALGPYGTLAGIVITGAFAAYKWAQNNGLLTTIEHKNAELNQNKQALAAVAGTSNPATVLAQAGAAQSSAQP